MLLLVTGSRGIQERTVINNVLNGILADCSRRGDQLWLLHGGAAGVDQIAHNWAWKMHISTTSIPPDYDDPTLKSRKQAPLRRNLKMLDMKPDLVVAFWDGQSPGTKHTIDNARRREIPVLLKKVGAFDDGRPPQPLPGLDAGSDV